MVTEEFRIPKREKATADRAPARGNSETNSTTWRALLLGDGDTSVADAPSAPPGCHDSSGALAFPCGGRGYPVTGTPAAGGGRGAVIEPPAVRNPAPGPPPVTVAAIHVRVAVDATRGSLC